jgi:hypothetical protein
MKKVIKLTESDLIRIVKRVIKEQSDSLPKKSLETSNPPAGKTPSVVNYKELKSQTTFAPQYKTGTPIVQIGTYYLSYPEFEEYKKSKPNTKFVKV